MNLCPAVEPVHGGDERAGIFFKFHGKNCKALHIICYITFMKRKLIISLLSLVIVLITMNIILYNWKKSAGYEPVNSGKNIEQMVDDCYENYQKDVAAGLNLYMDREMCYINVTEELGDYKICLVIKNDETKNQCLRTVAEKINDASICDKVNIWKNSCYFEVARNTKDVSICEKMNYEGDNHDGILNRNTCYYEISKINKDASICEKIINNKNLKESCQKDANSE